jgi:hypothetical protein
LRARARSDTGLRRRRPHGPMRPLPWDPASFPRPARPPAPRGSAADRSRWLRPRKMRTPRSSRPTPCRFAVDSTLRAARDSQRVVRPSGRAAGRARRQRTRHRATWSGRPIRDRARSFADRPDEPPRDPPRT